MLGLYSTPVSSLYLSSKFPSLIASFSSSNTFSCSLIAFSTSSWQVPKVVKSFRKSKNSLITPSDSSCSFSPAFDDSSIPSIKLNVYASFISSYVHSLAGLPRYACEIPSICKLYAFSIATSCVVNSVVSEIIVFSLFVCKMLFLTFSVLVVSCIELALFNLSMSFLSIRIIIPSTFYIIFSIGIKNFYFKNIYKS